MTAEEKKVISFQLGRTPDNLAGIARYCPFHKPAVLLTYPYGEKGIFPTTYWLSCPYLVREVSRLEDRGFIQELSDMLDNDDTFRERMMKAHQRYAENRMSLLSEDLEKSLQNKSLDILKVLKESGVGGIREKEGIKCLHTHLADYLVSEDNPVGELVFEKVDWPEDCHICDLS